MKILQFANGMLVNLDIVTDIQVVGNKITFNKINGTGAAQVYYAGDVAYTMLQIQRFNATGNGSLNVVDGTANGTITWASVTPNTTTVGALASFTFNGSGFLNFLNDARPGQAQIIADDGAGHVYLSYGIEPSGMGFVDNTFSAGFLTGTPFNVAGAYNLYYTTDAGGSRQACGSLVVTAS